MPLRILHKTSKTKTLLSQYNRNIMQIIVLLIHWVILDKPSKSLNSCLRKLSRHFCLKQTDEKSPRDTGKDQNYVIALNL